MKNNSLDNVICALSEIRAAKLAVIEGRLKDALQMMEEADKMLVEAYKQKPLAS